MNKRKWLAYQSIISCWFPEVNALSIMIKIKQKKVASKSLGNSCNQGMTLLLKLSPATCGNVLLNRAAAIRLRLYKARVRDREMDDLKITMYIRHKKICCHTSFVLAFLSEVCARDIFSVFKLNYIVHLFQ